ncbi:hypothetical protein C2845_PM13G12590 [Panicum miliaceum]|uniref:RNA-binding protein 25 n=1 Tax=Panicum miliaceum TaxID=4540 RepID=A0A3L6RLK9_PANMI|nr:hypothetical protein C2845_PM13G12590 [Panicum miliaceum]
MAAVAPPPDNLDPPPSTPTSSAPAAPPTAVTPPPAATSTPPNPATPGPAAASPNPNPSPAPVSTPPAAVAPPMPPAPVSFAATFRPLGAPPPPPHQVAQYGVVPPNSGYPMAQPMQPPGIPGVMPPGAVRPPTMYAPPQPGAYMPQPGAAVPHPGMPRYPTPYPMVRPGFVPRPMPPPGVVPIQRPPMIPGIRSVPPLVAPAARPPPPAVTPADKPPTAVYVGKIAPTVDNDFLLSLLRLCGSVKSWKRAQDPSNGKPKGFGFCEFESAEGILRATRLLNKLSIDGQELVININDATKEYLKKYVEEKKRAQEKAKETENGDRDGTTAVPENESSKPPDESDKATGDAGDKDSEENINKFGIITDKDFEADKDVAEKISSMIEEWLKTRPPPPPPPVQPSADSSGVDMKKPDSDDKNDADTDKRAVNETERSETGSPDKRKDRERDKDKRDKDFERHERERERERVRRDRERDREKDYKHREAEKLYRDRLKEWESREREKEYQRQNEKDKEKDRERDRRREILRQEDESDEEDNRKRKRRGSSTLEERKRRRQREKEEDLADKIREEEEIAEARRLAVELQRQADEAAAAAAAAAEEAATLMDVDGDDEEETNAQNKPGVLEVDNIASFANGVDAGGGLHKQNNSDETSMAPGQIPDAEQNSNVPAKKLGFGLVGLGKRTSVPSIFAEEDDENNVDKSIRPLVPIDYSNEEIQAVQANSSAGPNVAAAAEFAKCISVSNSKEEKIEAEKDRNRRSSEARVNDERREKIHDREKEKPKSENKKILDAKQLIDMIPRTKEELFAYDINWAIYDKHELHERMRPWISKKIIEFLGEEESTLVDYIVSCTKDHVQAEKMLELLQSILDVEAEMFVLKMWRMLIFEIKKVESGLSGGAKA